MKKETKTAQNSRERGQLSIFLGMTMIVVMTMIAFMVNVGLFVKAKINLQNAVDSAAWAGAAVQARQLTNISYLNWEMRNVYKEWMFKYYILGTKGLKRTDLANIKSPTEPGGPDPSKMNFRGQPFNQLGDADYKANVFDMFNAPSICIHFGSTHNICGIANLPGLPRFKTVGLPSISEHHESFLNQLVAKKALACEERTDINFGAALLWAYGTRSTKEYKTVPLIASDRIGAWPLAVELALRMRNLEMLVNRPPVSEPICGAAGGGACTTVEALENEASPQIPLNERPIKAFLTGFRNLGGGAIKNNDNSTGLAGDEFSGSFKLTELPPTPKTVDAESLSGFLIPAGATITGVSALSKHYLDLQIYPINFVTFYTNFVPTTDPAGYTSTVKAGGACYASKTALIIPGYPFGFIKNPEVLTYYAVKGEAKFIGLFFPFNEFEGIQMQAYAAAKPMGGRIGPRLFGIGADGRSVVPRDDGSQNRTNPYVLGFNTAGLTEFTVGSPIPFDPDFWINGSGKAIGGNPTSGEIFFGIPNMIFEYDNIEDLAVHNSGTSNYLELDRATTEPVARDIKEQMGLYDSTQFELFARLQTDITASPDTSMSGEEILKIIHKVRAPTKYEALNYLIPSLQELNDPDQLEVTHLINRANELPDAPGTFAYNLYAPLFGVGTLYANVSTIETEVGKYIDGSSLAIDKLIEGLKGVHDFMIDPAKNPTVGSAGYVEAAKEIYKPGPALAGKAAGDADCDSASVAQKFDHFFRGGSEGCGVLPLKERMSEYINDQAATNPAYALSYSTHYTEPKFNMSTLMTGFRPGPREGADDTGVVIGAFDSQPALAAKRNFYSTKFVSVKNVSDAGSDPYSQINPYIESKQLKSPNDLSGSIMANKLKASSLSDFGELFY
ncbi:MAG: Tad domain-containing protein [Halobacteriovoraceae bacterium]|nr:Tad domain-containing protein [Halobacteriovoraceae bacterium]